MKRQRIEVIVVMLLLLGAGGFLFLWENEREARSSLPDDSNPPTTNQQSEEAHETAMFEGRLLRSQPGRFAPGYTLYPVVGTAEVLLLTSDGEVAHRWSVDADRARLLPNCNILVVHGTKWGARVEPWNDLKFTVREYDWNGEVRWEFRSNERIHHDIQRLANGNTIFPIRTNLSRELHETIDDQRRRRLPSIRSDYLLEVGTDGNTVWRWDAEKFLDVNSCGKPDCRQENPADWTHMNTVSPLPENRWFDQGDSRFRPGNLLIVLRNWWMALIIDRKTGEFVWRYEGDYKGGLSGGHDAYMIPKGIPGAGNILIFDNGRVLHKGESYILEIEPPSKKLVWVYDVGADFFSNSAGSVQRLPNGNTLISEDLTGRVFEVTAEKEIVWEYDGNYRIARAHRYPPDHCPQLMALSDE